MARVNSLLSIVIEQGANELRLVSDREPRMLAHGSPKRLSIPSMPNDTVRDFLGDLLSEELLTQLKANGRVDVRYEAEGIGLFNVALTPQPNDGISAVFIHLPPGSARAGGAPASKQKIDAVPPAAPSAPAETVRESSFREGLLREAREAREAGENDAREAHAKGHDHHESAGEVAMAAGTRGGYATGGARALSEAFRSLVSRAAAMRASDLHLADEELPTARIDGGLRRMDSEDPVNVASIFGLDEASARAVLTRSSDRAYDIEGVGRVRVHIYSTSDGLAAAVRLLPPTAPSFASLDMPLAFDDVVNLPHGLVLVCGATGSGKSTTLAALAQEALRRRSIVLVTLEDPIEYKLTENSRSIVRRRQVGRDVADFAGGLRDALREDPDMLLVGEMRDAETIALALTAAETGHLVLASIHSRSTASAVERILDTYPPEGQTQARAQLAESLRVIVGQRLLPRAKGGGRIPAIEVLRVTRGVAAMIREGKTQQITSAIQSGKKDGSILLERSLADRVRAGEVRAEDARAHANDPDTLNHYLTDRA